MRVESLTFFRFVAALIVVLFHFGAGFGLPPALMAGQQMVTFFFVLSGFVMALAYFRRDHIDLGAYWWARFARIFPVYGVALLMMVVYALWQHGQFDPLAVMLNLLFLQAWVSPYPLSVNSPGWSLSVEMFLYLVFPLAVLLIRRYRVAQWLVFAVALGTWLVTQLLLIAALNLGWYQGYPSLSHDLIVYFPPVHLGSFLLGVAGGIWFVSRPDRVMANPVSLLLIAASFGLIVAMLQDGLSIQAWVGLKLPFESSFMALPFLLFIVSMASCHAPLIGVFSARPLVLLGEASYSLYILQIPMHHVYMWLTNHLVEPDPVSRFVGLLLFLVVVSVLSFVYFEKPANRYLRYAVPVMLRQRLARLSARG